MVVVPPVVQLNVPMLAAGAEGAVSSLMQPVSKLIITTERRKRVYLFIDIKIVGCFVYSARFLYFLCYSGFLADFKTVLKEVGKY